MYNIFKRLLDLGIASVSLIILLPLFVPVIIILRLTAEGEVFYLQERIGYKNSKFKIWKFASMLKNSLNLGTGSITLQDDFRVTKFGKFLRKTKINELPQLFNILLGHISVVGPRPMVPNTFIKYSSEAQTELKKVKPGLTGIGSIIFRNEEKFLEGKADPRKFYDDHIIPYKNKLELWFVKNNSITTYFKIILVTAWVLIFSRSSIVELLFREIPRMPHSLKR